MNLRNVFASVALATIVSVPFIADAKLAKTGDAVAHVNATGPAGLTITGTSTEVSVSDDGTTVTVDVKLGNITTGIKLRDKHTKNYLEVETYPSAKLTVPRASLKFPEAGKEVSADASGTLSLHGQTKDLKFHYTAKKDGDTITVHALSAPLTLTDYGIKVPSYLGVTVKPDVTVDTDFQVKDAS
jgi:polyisoprenoid-binding protein YceI